MPYKYGGGHAKIEDNGYDCSGTVSYALIHAGLLKSPLPSGPFMRWGEKGKGAWITVFAHCGHAYAVIAGLRLDTSAYASRTGPQQEGRQVGLRARSALAARRRARRAASARAIPLGL